MLTELEHRRISLLKDALVSAIKQVQLLAYNTKILAKYNHHNTKTYNARRFKAQTYDTGYVNNQTMYGRSDYCSAYQAWLK